MVFDFNSLGDILCCPDCQSPLVIDNDRLICTNPETRSVFPIRDGIPILLTGESDPLPEAEWKSTMEQSRPAAEETTAEPE